MGRMAKVASFVNPMGFIYFIKDLKDQYSLKFILMILSNYIGVRGAMKGFLDQNETPFYVEAGYPSSVSQTNRAISKLPGSIKGVGGLLSDLLPFAGYEKSSYMVLYSIMGGASIFFLAIIPFDVSTHSSNYPAIFFFFAQLHISFNDLLMEGKYADVMKDYPKNRGSLISFSFLCITAGSIIPSIFVGILADNLSSPRFTFWIAFPLAIQSIPFLLAGCMIKDNAAPERNNKFDFKKVKVQFPIVFIAFVMTLAVIGNFFITMLSTATVNIVFSIIASIVLNIVAFICLPIAVQLINLYLFLGQALYFQIQPTLEYYYIADEICLPGGPHFDFTYLKTLVGIMTIVGQLVGLWLYQSVLTKWKYRQIFWISTILRIAASMFDYVMVMRYNIAIGIPDKYFYIVGHAVIYEVTYMLDYLPFTLMISKICPRNIEVTLYSLLGGFTHYGGTIAIFAGGYVIELFGIATNLEGGTCNWEGIGWVVIICNLIFPALLIPAAFYFIPNKPVGENIADETFENGRYLFSSIRYNKYVDSVTQTKVVQDSVVV